MIWLTTTTPIVLNKDGEVLIGDTLVWYARNGKKHFILNKDESELNRIRLDPSQSKLMASYTARPIKNSSKSGIQNRAPVHDLDARYQHEWNWRGDSNWRRKFVNELYVWWDASHYHSQIFIRIKDERWASIGWFQYDWRPTQDTRIIAYNLTASATLLGGHIYYYGGGPTEWTYSGSNYMQTNSDYQIFIAQDNYIYQQYNDDWSIEVSGNIYQWLPNDYPYNAWEINGFPLW